MTHPRDESAAPSRRSVLRAAGGAASGLGLAGLATPAAATATQSDDAPDGWSVPVPRNVRVVTRNLGLGARLYGFVDTDSLQVEPAQVYERYQQVRASAPGERMRAIAAGLAAELPAVVGLQEVARIRRGPNDYTGGSEPNAEREVYDFLELLTDGLEAELERYDFDVGYEVAVVSGNLDEEFPAEGPDGERFDVRLTDRDVVLVRDDLTVRSTDDGDYGLNVSAVLEDGTRVSVTRGYALATVELEGARFSFVTTHLAVASRIVREAQAVQLAGLIERRDGPVVLAGDLNTTPEGDRSSAYERLVESGLRDTWAALRDEPGPTCCQGELLRNNRSRLRSRVDHVMTAGPVVPLAARRTDTDPGDRIEVDTPDGPVRLWSSDHAGVVADVRVEPRTREFVPLLQGLLFG
ncbi:endonuclease/exonuclease/phosphatase family protein [Haloglomus litoreum]|uniref:endonuclease/exonuclease/phosphatase family protein n=1 Tax=Haloglomus litoreum TaxID=3034026 RepID=UPI0023E7CAA1|nr:endonuclease/exonuclease/phosphatase family protein [Haloglomus sp. DT116]